MFTLAFAIAALVCVLFKRHASALSDLFIVLSVICALGYAVI